MMLYTYLDERQTARYWKKIARMVSNSFTLYKENYRGRGKLKFRYYTLSIIKSLGEEWLALKDNAGAEGNTRTQNTP
jgi:hypothetical protein